MEPTITSEVVVAYSQCLRKAYLLLYSQDRDEPHEYVRILEQERCENQRRYVDRLKQKHPDVQLYTADNLRKGSEILINARLKANGFEAECGVLTRVEGTSAFGRYSYDPTTFVGTYSVSNEQKLELSFIGRVLGHMQNKPPAAGRIIGMDGRSYTVKLGNSPKVLIPLIEPLQEWVADDSPDQPPIVLNKHCPHCPFRYICREEAEQEDNLEPSKSTNLSSLAPSVCGCVMGYHLAEREQGVMNVANPCPSSMPLTQRAGAYECPIFPLAHQELRAVLLDNGLRCGFDTGDLGRISIKHARNSGGNGILPVITFIDRLIEPLALFFTLKATDPDVQIFLFLANKTTQNYHAFRDLERDDLLFHAFHPVFTLTWPHAVLP
jgi:hypothetical protein